MYHYSGRSNDNLQTSWLPDGGEEALANVRLDIVQTTLVETTSPNTNQEWHINCLGFHLAAGEFFLFVFVSFLVLRWVSVSQVRTTPFPVSKARDK